jgi:hypothetical protein
MPLLRPRAVGAPIPGGRIPVSASGQKTLDLVLKWIPVEIIALYQAVIAAIPTSDGDLRLGATYVAIVVCAAWIAFATKPANEPIAWRQMILSTLAFIFWAVAVQSEVLEKVYDWKPVIGGLVLIFGSALLPIFDGILARLGVPQ